MSPCWKPSCLWNVGEATLRGRQRLDRLLSIQVHRSRFPKRPWRRSILPTRATSVTLRSFSQVFQIQCDTLLFHRLSLGHTSSWKRISLLLTVLKPNVWCLTPITSHLAGVCLILHRCSSLLHLDTSNNLCSPLLLLLCWLRGLYNKVPLHPASSKPKGIHYNLYPKNGCNWKICTNPKSSAGDVFNRLALKQVHYGRSSVFQQMLPEFKQCYSCEEGNGTSISIKETCAAEKTLVYDLHSYTNKSKHTTEQFHSEILKQMIKTLS